MSLSGMITGIAIFIFCMFLALAVPHYLTGTGQQALDVLKVFFFFIGASAIFIGAIHRG